MKITPTVGRVVHYFPHQHDSIGQGRGTQPLAAMVAHVNEDGTVNLTVADARGYTTPRVSVLLVQPGDDVTPAAIRTGYCMWMAYQVGQAAKTEQLEKQLSAGG